MSKGSVSLWEFLLCYVIMQGFFVLGNARCAMQPDVNGHVEIPRTWNRIDDSAFLDCNGLISVKIPESVESIEFQAFKSCTHLTSITIPDSVRRIGNYSFQGCSGLANVTIGQNVTRIGAGAFSQCTSLQSLIIPDGVTQIADSTFYRCFSLSSVQIPYGVLEIGWGAFQQCLGLLSINIPESVTFIGIKAFRECKSLSSVTIPDGVTKIGSYAFSECENLKAVSLSKSLKILDDDLFRNCISLHSIELPHGLEMIGNYAFFLSDISSVYIPSTVTKIGAGAFSFMNVLQNVTLGPSYSTVFREHSFASNPKMKTLTLMAKEIYFLSDPFTVNSLTTTTIVVDRRAEVIDGLPSRYGLLCAKGRCGCAKGYENLMKNDSSLFACSSCQMGFKNSIEPWLDLCEMCTPGRYASQEASALCEPCASGKFGLDYFAISESTCHNCSVGMYAPARGSSTCLSCPAGSACPSNGTSEYARCDRGTYNSYQGQTQCLLCPSGTYGPYKGAAVCEDCPRGRYNGGMGADKESYCVDCPPGRFGDKGGFSNCTVCPTGQYQPEEGMQICKECTLEGKFKTNNAAHTACVVDEDLLGKSIVELLFKNNAAYYVSFSISAFFVAVCVAMHYLRLGSESNEQCTAEGGLGNLKLWQVVLKSALPGFSFGSEMVLLIAIFSERPSIGVAMVIFRLLHMFATVFFLIALFGSIKTETFVQKTLSDASNWKAELNKVFAASNIPIVGAILLLCVCDISLVQMLPWKRTDFYAKSNGFPSKSLMRFSLGIDMIQAGGSAICTIVYLTLSSDQSDPTTSLEARLLFAMNISLSLLTLIMSLVVLFLKDRLLGSSSRQSLNKEMQGRPTPRTSATLELELKGIYDDPSDDASDGTAQRQYSNPLHVNQPASDRAGYDQGISRAELDAKDAEIRKIKAEFAATDAALRQELTAMQLAHREEIQRIMEATSAKNASYEGQML